MKCQKLLSIFLQLLLLIYVTESSNLSRKKTNYRKWFSKKLFQRAKAKFDRSQELTNEANAFITTANKLISPIINKEPMINNDIGLVSLVKKKLGELTKLSDFTLFLSGFFVGDMSNKLEKGYSTSRAKKTIRCLKRKFKSILNKDAENMKEHFLTPIQKLVGKIDERIINGSSTFFKNITNIKIGDSKEEILSNDEGVKLFLNTMNQHNVRLAEYIIINNNQYAKCKLKSKPRKQLSELDRRFEKEFTFQKIKECEVSPDKNIENFIKNKALITELTTFWTQLFIKGKIEKKWDTVLWYDLGKSVGTLFSRIIRPNCKKEFKEEFLERWERRLLKKSK